MKRYTHVNQIGFVVNDMEKALEEYGRIYKIKKWYRAGRRPGDDMFFKGSRISDPGFDLIVGYCGRTEIELITTSAAESLYADFINDGRTGLHHVSFFVNDLEASVEELRGMGFEVVQSGYMSGLTERTDYAYMARPDDGFGCIVEFSSTKIFGKIPFQRGWWNIWAGVLTGNARVVKRMK